ncbi:conserved Plasmodium protein, unknown function [Plasmodium ovale wallikeri]|uniref:Uncharacterized protein n=2 Tax=Plasmodium ovale TaxID=36330 RepID=A0A1C3KMC2_PLAOA|nr:conserved Plasmodium protein, unknown function [Plasmodium ovale wallikeri]SBT75136.1 conserved Plasmodium protein, unknown function [Plasmodium ovale]
MIKKINPSAVPAIKWRIKTNNGKPENFILKTLIEKLVNIKKENKFFNCVGFYDFLHGKYGSYFSMEDCFKLFYLQNKDFFFSKKLMRHICFSINNASIFSILKIKKEYVIDHIYNCNIYKYKCNFQNEYYHFTHNLLLLCCLQLCSPTILEKLDEDQKKIMKLKHLHTKYQPNSYIQLFHSKNVNRKKTFDNIEYFLKLYKCFSRNKILPFSFLNKHLYHSLYITSSNVFARNSLYNSIFKEEPFLSSFNVHLPHNKQMSFLKTHHISEILFYLSKNNLYFYYDSLLKTYFYLILIYTHSWARDKEDEISEIHFNIQNEFLKKEEETIDNIIVSLINFLSSAYVMNTVQSNVTTVVLCIYISLTLLNLVYKRHFACFNWSHFNAFRRETKKNDFFLVTRENGVSLCTLSFIKKCMLLIYVVNDIIPQVYADFKHKQPNCNNEIASATKYVKRNAQLMSVQIEGYTNNRSSSKIDGKRNNLYSDNICKSVDTNINQNAKLFLEELFFKHKLNILHFIQLPFLKLLHYQTYFYTQCNKINGIVNAKKSALEKEIFFNLQQYLEKRFPEYMCQLGRDSSSMFFTVDIEICKKEKPK